MNPLSNYSRGGVNKSSMDSNEITGGSRTTATSKMELCVIIVNGFQPLTIITKCCQLLTIITKCSILDVTAILDPPL